MSGGDFNGLATSVFWQFSQSNFVSTIIIAQGHTFPQFSFRINTHTNYLMALLRNFRSSDAKVSLLS